MSLRYSILIMMVLAAFAQANGQTVGNWVERDKRSYMDMGGDNDGFSAWTSDGLSLKPCRDRYIAAGESVTIRVDGRADSFKWYRDGQFLTAGWKSYTDSPHQTSVYKVVAQFGDRVDSCFITVHVVDRFGGKNGDGFAIGSSDLFFLNGGGDRYIAGRETVVLRAESHTDKLTWYNASGLELGKGFELAVTPSATSVYKVVAQAGMFHDSCYVTVHVHDDFAGGEGDGFGWSRPPTYFVGCGDRFIAKAGSSEIYVESHTNSVTWYDASGTELGRGKNVVVTPGVTTVYKAVGADADFLDSCYVTVHVKDNYTGELGDGFDTSQEPMYLTAGPERFIANKESVTIKVWSHTQNIVWYDERGSRLPEEGKQLTVSPDKTATYKAVSSDLDFLDSCYVTVHVNDNYAGDVADGFAVKYEDELYLKGSSDRYIAKEESVIIGIEAHSSAIKWYSQPDNVLVGAGKLVTVSPDSTTLYKAVVDLGTQVDSCYVTVHVVNNFKGEIADGFTKNCDRPRILETIPVNGQPCAGADDIMMKVVCFDRDATYKWQKYDSVAKKYAAIPDSIGRDMVGKDSSVLLFNKLRPAFNGVYRCVVDNTCGAGVSLSDSLLLHVNRCAIDLEMVPDTVEICKNETKRIAVNLLDGAAPWEYTYRTPGLAEVKCYVTDGLTDTIEVSTVGTYQIVYLKDATGDVRVGSENLPFVVVKQREQPEVLIQGPERELCWGAEAAISLSVTKGVGPWKVWIYRDNDELADEMTPNPVEMTGRDTVLKFTVIESMTYHIGGIEDYYGGKFVCDGDAVGVATVTVSPLNSVTLKPLADNHFGQCNSVDLHTVLEPKVGDRVLTAGEGTFYVDGVALAGGWWMPGNVRAGCHKVYFEPLDGACVASSPEIQLCLDSVTASASLSKHDVCIGQSLDYRVVFGSKGYSYTWENIRVDMNGNRTSLRNTEALADSAGITRVVTWIGDENSCQIFNILSVTDRHGCSLVKGLPLRDTVYNHQRPSLKVLTRTDGSSWSESRYPEIRKGDVAGIRGVLDSGTPPWVMWGSMVTPSGADFKIYSNGLYADTVLREEGLYSFKLEDRYCGNWLEEKYVFLRYLKSAYVSLRVLLEGPYNKTGGVMESGIAGTLPRYFGMDHLPVSDGAIDWIEVELRQGRPGMTAAEVAAMGDNCRVVLRDTCLLKEDGTVVDRNGNSKIEFTHGLTESTDCYVVLHHRNHLAVMSAKPYRITTSVDSVVTVDFTKMTNVYTSKSDKVSEHMSMVGEMDGRQVWALSVGEVNENAIVSLLDPNDVKNFGLEKGRMGGYNVLDVNFDGIINWPGWNNGTNSLPDDWIVSRMNRDKYTEIRFKDVK